jgi:hypothetical protein
MPHIETPDDLAEAIADMAGVYGACKGDATQPCDGRCRPHFIGDMTERIRDSVANEKLLGRAPAPSGAAPKGLEGWAA